jgi:hypothetical protein
MLGVMLPPSSRARDAETAAAPITADAPRTRPADRLVLYGEPVSFRELCRRAVPENANYLVLDLDRTLHLGRNMGELLGFDLAAYHAYGKEALAAAEPRRRPGRFFLDWRRPLALLRYFWIGARMWALPGLFYLFYGKIASRVALLRRFVYRLFGSEPVVAVQRVPQTALLHHLGGVPAVELRALASRVWDRHTTDLVIEREDLDWLRARCPGIKIIIASASPEPTVAVAGAALGVDDIVFSTVEEHEGWFSPPFRFPPTVLAPEPPRRLSGPAQTRITSSRSKIESLWARHPALADPGVVSVGITDTDHGEDHCWLEHFTRVVDVNSTTPFPPFVAASSPLREIHSAAVLTRRERERRAHGDARYLDPRRPPRLASDRSFSASDLSALLRGVAAEVERIARDLEARAADLKPARERVRARLDAWTGRIEAIVHAFNDAASRERHALFARLKGELKTERTLLRELARVERPLSELACVLSGLLAGARGVLSGERMGEGVEPEAPLRSR